MGQHLAPAACVPRTPATSLVATPQPKILGNQPPPAPPAALHSLLAGLPEYLSQTKQSLAQGYSVLVLQSADEGSGCLSSSTRDGRLDDRPRVRAWAGQGAEWDCSLFRGQGAGGTGPWAQPRRGPTVGSMVSCSRSNTHVLLRCRSLPL